MLDKFISVIVPATKDKNQPIDTAAHLEAVRKIARALSLKCGGASAERVLGFWVSDTLGLIEEPTTRVKSYYDDTQIDPADAVNFIRQLACNLKEEFSQEAVMIETEAGADFI